MTRTAARISLLLAVAFLLFSGGVEHLYGNGGEAEARAGRPLTPVSVAGAGRRTVRRCAAGVYNC